MTEQIPANRAEFWQDFDSDPWHAYLGIRLLEQRENYGKLELRPNATTPKGIGGSVHGGALATLVDVAALAAVHGKIGPAEQPAGTAELSLSYLRQAQGARLICEAEIVKRGRQLAVADVRIFNDRDQLCCLGKVTYAFRVQA